MRLSAGAVTTKTGMMAMWKHIVLVLLLRTQLSIGAHAARAFSAAAADTAADTAAAAAGEAALLTVQAVDGSVGVSLDASSGLLSEIVARGVKHAVVGRTTLEESSELHASVSVLGDGSVRVVRG